MQNQNELNDVHRKYDDIMSGKERPAPEKLKCPYEFLASADRGWIPCDVSEADTEKELVKVIFPHPDAAGWMDVTGAAGIYQEVVEMWRVRVRED